MREVLGLDRTAGGNNNIKAVSAQHHGALLASLDYHGAEIEVVRCACVGRVGTKGIVVRDTKFTFVVVTRADEVRSKSILFFVPAGNRSMTGSGEAVLG